MGLDTCIQCSLVFKWKKKPKDNFCNKKCEEHYYEKYYVKSLRDKKKLYNSKGWLVLRYEKLKNSKGRCDLCGSNNLLQVDHIKPVSKYPHLAFELNNLQVLCRDCNIGKGNRDEVDWRGV